MKSRFYGIAELALVVSDLEKARHFYIDVVGFEPASGEIDPGACVLRIGKNRYLGLWEPGVWHSDYLPPGESSTYFGASLCPAHPVFAIHGDDIAALAERLRDAGYVPHGPIRHQNGCLHLYVLDPDNHAVEFWGWTHPEG